MAYLNPNTPLFPSSEIVIDVQQILDELVIINEDIDTLNSDVTTINGQISTINDAISDITGDISQLNTDILAIQANVTTLASEVNTIQVTLANQQIGAIYKTSGPDQNVVISAGVYHDIDVTDTLALFPGSFDSIAPGFLNYSGPDYWFNVTAAVSGTIAAGANAVVTYAIAINGVRQQGSHYSISMTTTDYTQVNSSIVLPLTNGDFLSIQAICVNPITLGIDKVNLTAIRII